MSYCYDNNVNLYFNEGTIIYFVTFFTFGVIGIFLLILNKYTFFDKRKISRGATPKIPFGNMRDVLFQSTPFYIYLWKYYNRFKRKGFKYAGLYLLLKPCILLVDPKIINNVLLNEKQFRNVKSKKFEFTNNIKLDRLLDEEIILNSFDLFKHLKNSLIDNLKNKTDNVENIILSTFVDLTLSAIGITKNEESIIICNLHSKCINVQDGLVLNFLYYISLCFPGASLIFDTSHHKYIKNIRRLIEIEIQMRKKNDVRKKDIVQRISDLSNNQGSLDLNEAVLSVLQLFLDNVAYSYSTMLFCLYELSKNTEIQDDLTGEIRRFNKKFEYLDIDNMSELVYMDAVVKETLRKYPPRPVISKIPLEEYKNTDLNVDIPKNCLVWIPTYAVHHDQNNYNNPELFDPDRFFEDNKSRKGVNHLYMPFGNEPEHSRGGSLSTLHVKLILYSILSNFKISIPPNDNYEMEFDNTKLWPHPKEKLPLCFELL